MPRKKRKSGSLSKEKFLNTLGAQYSRDLTNKATSYEILFRSVLEEAKINYVFQYPVICRREHLFIIDFFLPEYKVAFELDGSQHYTKEGQRADKRRTKLLAEFGIMVKRIKNFNVKLVDVRMLREYLSRYTKIT